MKSAFALIGLAALIVATASATPKGGKEEKNSEDAVEKRFKELEQQNRKVQEELKKIVEKQGAEIEALNDKLERQKVEDAALHEADAALNEASAKQLLQIAELREATREENAKQKKRQADTMKREKDIESAVKKIVVAEMEKYRAANPTCETGHSGIISNGRDATKNKDEWPQWTKTIKFARVFPRPPTFMVALDGFNFKKGFGQAPLFNAVGGKGWGKTVVNTASAVVTNVFSDNVDFITFTWLACL